MYRRLLAFAAAAFSALLGGVLPCLAITFVDPAGDAGGPDITAMEYVVSNGNLDIKLSFAQNLSGSVINQSMLASISIDIDKSLMTGFSNLGGLPPRYGCDYEISLMVMGFNSGDGATLKYWRHKSEPPYVSLDRVSVALGDLWTPNGSVFVVGANSTYGTTSKQIFLRVPLSLFSNDYFPFCSDELTFCTSSLISCPLALTRNLADAYVQMIAFDMYYDTSADVLPASGVLSTASGAVMPYYSRANPTVQASDPSDDCYAPPGLNGEEITGLSAYAQEDGNLSLEIKLKTYSMEDTAGYYLYLDLDDNAATGFSFSGIGADLIAYYQNFENPISEANPLEGKLTFRVGQTSCTLLYTDHLASVWRSTPGYVWITLPQGAIQPYLATNASGIVRVVAAANEPEYPEPENYVDLAPNSGAMAVPMFTPTPAAPVAFFNADKTSGAAPLTVQFTDASTGDVTEWLWNFGDGKSSVEQNPSHNYTEAGGYDVTLTVSGPGGDNGLTRANYITVYAPLGVRGFLPEILLLLEE